MAEAEAETTKSEEELKGYLSNDKSLFKLYEKWLDYHTILLEPHVKLYLFQTFKKNAPRIFRLTYETGKHVLESKSELTYWNWKCVKIDSGRGYLLKSKTPQGDDCYIAINEKVIFRQDEPLDPAFAFPFTPEDAYISVGPDGYEFPIFTDPAYLDKDEVGFSSSDEEEDDYIVEDEDTWVADGEGDYVFSDTDADADDEAEGAADGEGQGGCITSKEIKNQEMLEKLMEQVNQLREIMGLPKMA